MSRTKKLWGRVTEREQSEVVFIQEQLGIVQDRSILLEILA